MLNVIKVFVSNDIGLLLSIAAPCALIGWVFYTGSVYDNFKKRRGQGCSKDNKYKADLNFRCRFTTVRF